MGVRVPLPELLVAFNLSHSFPLCTIFCCHQKRSKRAPVVSKDMSSKQDPAQSTTQSLSSGSKTQSMLWVFGFSAWFFVKVEPAHPAGKC